MTCVHLGSGQKEDLTDNQEKQEGDSRGTNQNTPKKVKQAPTISTNFPLAKQITAGDPIGSTKSKVGSKPEEKNVSSINFSSNIRQGEGAAEEQLEESNKSLQE